MEHGIKTADLYDAHEGEVQVAEPLMRSYGRVAAFGGPLATVKVHEDNSLVRAALSEAGDERVLVIDGGGSLRCALVGDRLAALALENGWAGIIVYGCIRDALEIGQMAIGVQALATHPRKSIKRNEGVRDIIVSFAGVSFSPGAYVYADTDGILVSARALL
jgi:regulator of ribonuclease activity A